MQLENINSTHFWGLWEKFSNTTENYIISWENSESPYVLDVFPHPSPKAALHLGDAYSSSRSKVMS